MLLGHRVCRRDSAPGLISDDGSNRPKGMGSVGAAVDGGVQGWVAVFDVPVFAQLRAALNGAYGYTGVIGLYLPLELANDFTLTMLPTVTRANRKQAGAGVL